MTCLIICFRKCQWHRHPLITQWQHFSSVSRRDVYLLSCPWNPWSTHANDFFCHSTTCRRERTLFAIGTMHATLLNITPFRQHLCRAHTHKQMLSHIYLRHCTVTLTGFLHKVPNSKLAWGSLKKWQKNKNAHNCQKVVTEGSVFWDRSPCWLTAD